MFMWFNICHDVYIPVMFEPKLTYTHSIYNIYISEYILYIYESCRTLLPGPPHHDSRARPLVGFHSPAEPSILVCCVDPR